MSKLFKSVFVGLIALSWLACSSPSTGGSGSVRDAKYVGTYYLKKSDGTLDKNYGYILQDTGALGRIALGITYWNRAAWGNKGTTMYDADIKYKDVAIDASSIAKDIWDVFAQLSEDGKTLTKTDEDDGIIRVDIYVKDEL
jgi:hypothetical protein